MTAPVEEPYLSDSRLLAALCVWREARGEVADAKLGVAWVLKNRCKMAPAQGFKPDIAGNVLKPWAFSSFSAGDPNADRYPAVADQVWLDCLAAADSVKADPTGGAVFYYSPPLTEPPHAWGLVQLKAVIGHLHFYAIQETAT